MGHRELLEGNILSMSNLAEIREPSVLSSGDAIVNRNSLHFPHSFLLNLVPSLEKATLLIYKKLFQNR